jgi:hypothetical protein
MGFLDLFRRRPLLAVQCWLDEAARWNALPAAVAEDVRHGDHVLVVAHFKEALARAGEQLARANIPFTPCLRWSDAEERALLAGEPVRVFLVLARDLPDPPPATGQRDAHGARGAGVVMRVVDLHVLPEENQRILRCAGSLPVPARATASVSLDDPVLAHFASPWTKSLLARMGMTSNEAIESPMVSKSIHRALAKLADRMSSRHDAASIEEWLRLNRRN